MLFKNARGMYAKEAERQAKKQKKAAAEKATAVAAAKLAAGAVRECKARVSGLVDG